MLDTNFDISNLRAIIFDFDGTIVDSEPTWKKVFVELFEKSNGITISQEILWANTGGGVDLSVKNISDKCDLAMTEKEITEMAHEIHDETERRILSELSPRPGFVELLNWSATNKIKTAICTASKDQLISQYFAQLNLEHNFDAVISTANSSFTQRKPYPYPYEKSLEALEIENFEGLTIEDSPAGVASSTSAGIATIAMHNEFLFEEVEKHKPMVQVQDFFQVLELLDS